MNTDKLIEARVAARIKGELKGLVGDKLEQYVKTAVRNRFRNELRDSQAYSQSNFENRMASFEGLAESGHGVDRSDGGLGVRRMVGEIDRGEREARQFAIINATAAKLPRNKRWAVATSILWGLYKYRDTPDAPQRIRAELNLSARQYAGGLKKLKNWLSANKYGAKSQVGKRQTRQNR